jgi:hypothetical protein
MRLNSLQHLSRQRLVREKALKSRSVLSDVGSDRRGGLVLWWDINRL